MNKAEKKFRTYAITVVFILLSVLLAVINGVNFTMASSDADEITRMIAERQGSFERAENAPGEFRSEPREKNFRVGPMGPDSPEMNDSLRYFTFAFKEDGSAETVAFRISAVTESEAREWASELLKEKTGWTRGSYRYRVYSKDGVKYVTVIDQGRELLPCYRILAISAAGEAIVLILGWFLLLAIAKKIYAPIEEADRKQKNFILNANREFRLPLTIIGGNTELSEKEHGPDDATRSTRWQLAKLNGLVEKLGTMGVFDGEASGKTEVPISEFLSAAIDREKDGFASKGIEVSADIEPGVTLNADPEAFDRLTGELVKNALKFSVSKAGFTLKKENGYVLIETQNDTTLPDGPADQVFDRFVTLENAPERELGAGLGLAYVKETVNAHKGRARASVSDSTFRLSITL